jgi:histidine triad (HIT) family protein
MTDCIFCKIIAGQIPCTKLYEDEMTFAFMDIAPISPGHALVVHKHHHADIFDTPERDLCDIMSTAKKVATAAMKATNCDGVNVTMNNRPASGQLVFHLHVHVIPRMLGDGLKPWPHKPTPPGEIDKLGDKIRAALSQQDF